MSTRKGLVLAALTAVAMAAGVADAEMYGGGSGTAAEPYLIYTVKQMNAIGENPDDWGKHFKLMADIDLRGLGGSDFNIIGSPGNPFRGTFDGNGKVISNLTLTSRDRLMGVFSWIYGGRIKNLGLIDPHIERGSGHTGGALVGMINGGSVSRCYVSGGSVTACCDSDSIGGLVGYIMDGTVSECYSSARVSGAMAFVGGLVGYLQDGTISNCYSVGSASGQQQIGGLVGAIKRGTVTDCYSAASVAGNVYAGGLVGYNHWGIIKDSFWDIPASGRTWSAGGTGKTTKAMMQQATFVNWDFIDVWDIVENETRPFLRVFAPVVEVEIDVKPGSCPNPLNPASNGVLPVAVLGLADFDVNCIDAVSIRLAGVAPVRHGYEDVAAPVSDGNECDCNENGPDGYTDLTLKFKVQEIATELAITPGDLAEDDVLVLQLTGNLADGTRIEGGDCVRIAGELPAQIRAGRSDVNKDGMVDLRDFAMMSQDWLESGL